MRRATGAQCVVLADEQGRQLARVGNATSVPLDTALTMLVDEARMTTLVSGYLNDAVEISLHHYEGKQFRIYTAVATGGPFLLMVMDRQSSLRHSGVVWLFLRRALHELRGTLHIEQHSRIEALLQEETE